MFKNILRVLAQTCVVMTEVGLSTVAVAVSDN